MSLPESYAVVYEIKYELRDPRVGCGLSKSRLELEKSEDLIGNVDRSAVERVSRSRKISDISPPKNKKVTELQNSVIIRGTV